MAGEIVFIKISKCIKFFLKLKTKSPFIIMFYVIHFLELFKNDANNRLSRTYFEFLFFKIKIKYSRRKISRCKKEILYRRTSSIWVTFSLSIKKKKKIFQKPVTEKFPFSSFWSTWIIKYTTLNISRLVYPTQQYPLDVFPGCDRIYFTFVRNILCCPFVRLFPIYAWYFRYQKKNYNWMVSQKNMWF